MGTTLSVITFVLAVLFMVAEGGLGAWRGMKKELCRIGVLFVIGLLLFFLIPGVAKALILAVVRMVYPGSGSFSDVAGIIAQEMQLNAAAVSVIETVLALVMSMLIPFVFVILFWVCKLLSWPLFAVGCMIYKHLCEKKNYAVPVQTEMAAAKEPDTTQRLIGAAIGMVAGLFIGALTFMPLTQLSKTVDGIGKETIAEFTDEETADALCFWKESPAGTFYRVTQMENLFGLLHNSLAKVEINGKVYEAKSLTELLEIVPDVIVLAEELEDADIGKLATVAEPLKTIVEAVLDISLFSEEEKIEMVRRLAEEGLANGRDSNEISAAALKGLEQMEFAEVKNDVLAAIDLIVVLDRYGLTDIEDPDAVIKVLANEQFINEGTDAIYALNLAEQVLPVAVNSLLGSVLAELDVVVTPVEPIENFQETKEEFKTLLRLFGKLANAGTQLGSIGEVKELVQNILQLKGSPFVSDATIAGLEREILGQVFTRENIKSIVDDVVEERLEEIRKSSKEEIDDETVEKTKETVVEYLTGNEEVTLESVTKVIEKMEDGSLMDKIDDADVIEEIKNGCFDLSQWLED